MGMKITYNCDICRDNMPKSEMVGCYFQGIKKFTLSKPENTEGVHICKGCLNQIVSQAAKYLKESGG